MAFKEQSLSEIAHQMHYKICTCHTNPVCQSAGLQGASFHQAEKCSWPSALPASSSHAKELPAHRARCSVHEASSPTCISGLEEATGSASSAPSPVLPLPQSAPMAVANATSKGAVKAASALVQAAAAAQAGCSPAQVVTHSSSCPEVRLGLLHAAVASHVPWHSGIPISCRTAMLRPCCRSATPHNRPIAKRPILQPPLLDINTSSSRGRHAIPHKCPGVHAQLPICTSTLRRLQSNCKCIGGQACWVIGACIAHVAGCLHAMSAAR